MTANYKSHSSLYIPFDILRFKIQLSFSVSVRFENTVSKNDREYTYFKYHKIEMNNTYSLYVYYILINDTL